MLAERKHISKYSGYDQFFYGFAKQWKNGTRKLEICMCTSVSMFIKQYHARIIENQ